ncbi:uncharacterized protein LAESUDRAFT_726671, partial [Laetiporus sulphureus 93-53]
MRRPGPQIGLQSMDQHGRGFSVGEEQELWAEILIFELAKQAGVRQMTIAVHRL